MRIDLVKRCDVIDEIVNTLLPLKTHTTDINKLTARVSESKSSLGKIKESSLQSVQTALSNNLNNENMHQDLKRRKPLTHWIKTSIWMSWVVTGLVTWRQCRMIHMIASSVAIPLHLSRIMIYIILATLALFFTKQHKFIFVYIFVVSLLD